MYAIPKSARAASKKGLLDMAAIHSHTSSKPGRSRSKTPTGSAQNSPDLRTKQNTDDESVDSGVIRCICGYSEDDGFTIQCEKCLVWQHTVCVHINDEQEVPDHYYCEQCEPRFLDADRARELQKRNFEADSRTSSPPKSKKQRKSTSAQDGADKGTSSRTSKKRKSLVVRSGATAASGKRSSGARGPSTNGERHGSNATGELMGGRRSPDCETTETPQAADDSAEHTSEEESPDADSKNAQDSTFLREILHRDYDVSFFMKFDNISRSRAEPTIPKDSRAIASSLLQSIKQAENSDHDSRWTSPLFPDVDLRTLLVTNSERCYALSDLSKLRRTCSDCCKFLVFSAGNSSKEDKAFQSPSVGEMMNMFGERPSLLSTSNLSRKSLVGQIVGDVRIQPCGRFSQLTADTCPRHGGSQSVPYAPFVFHHPGLPVNVDTRFKGNDNRWIRRGCRGNVRLCTMILDDTSMDEAGDELPSLSLGLFADKDVPEGDELVLRWTQQELQSLGSCNFQWLCTGRISEESPGTPNSALETAASSLSSVVYLECASCTAREYSTCLVYKMLSSNENLCVLPYDSDVYPKAGLAKGGRVPRTGTKRKRGGADRDSKSRSFKRFVVLTSDGKALGKPVSSCRSKAKRTSDVRSMSTSERPRYPETEPSLSSVLEDAGWTNGLVTEEQADRQRYRPSRPITFFESLETAISAISYTPAPDSRGTTVCKETRNIHPKRKNPEDRDGANGNQPWKRPRRHETLLLTSDTKIQRLEVAYIHADAETFNLPSTGIASMLERQGNFIGLKQYWAKLYEARRGKTAATDPKTGNRAGNSAQTASCATSPKFDGTSGDSPSPRTPQREPCPRQPRSLQGQSSHHDRCLKMEAVRYAHMGEARVPAAGERDNFTFYPANASAQGNHLKEESTEPTDHAQDSTSVSDENGDMVGISLQGAQREQMLSSSGQQRLKGTSKSHRGGITDRRAKGTSEVLTEPHDPREKSEAGLREPATTNTCQTVVKTEPESTGVQPNKTNANPVPSETISDPLLEPYSVKSIAPYEIHTNCRAEEGLQSVNIKRDESGRRGCSMTRDNMSDRDGANILSSEQSVADVENRRALSSDQGLGVKSEGPAESLANGLGNQEPRTQSGGIGVRDVAGVSYRLAASPEEPTGGQDAADLLPASQKTQEKPDTKNSPVTNAQGSPQPEREKCKKKLTLKDYKRRMASKPIRTSTTTDPVLQSQDSATPISTGSYSATTPRLSFTYGSNLPDAGTLEVVNVKSEGSHEVNDLELGKKEDPWVPKSQGANFLELHAQVKIERPGDNSSTLGTIPISLPGAPVAAKPLTAPSKHDPRSPFIKPDRYDDESDRRLVQEIRRERERERQKEKERCNDYFPISMPSAEEYGDQELTFSSCSGESDDDQSNYT